MTKTESAHLTAQTVLLESAEQVLQLQMAAGVRLAIPNTDALIMVGPADWIAKNVPGVEAMVEGEPVAVQRYGWVEDTSVGCFDIRPREDGQYVKFADIEHRLAATTQASTAQAESPWQHIDTLPYADDLVWLKHGDSIEGPRAMSTDDYDRFSEWAPCEHPSILAATSSTDAQAAAEVRDAALAWWESKRPVSWSEQEHAEVPEVNCAGDERSLARAVAAIRALRAGDTGEQADGGAAK